MALFVNIIAGLIALLPATVVLRAAAQWVADEYVDFWYGYVTLFIVWLVNMFLKFTIAFIVGSSAGFLTIPAGFFAQAGILVWRLNSQPQTNRRLRVSFGRACLISLVMTAIWIGIMFILMFLLGFIGLMIS